MELVAQLIKEGTPSTVVAIVAVCVVIAQLIVLLKTYLPKWFDDKKEPVKNSTKDIHIKHIEALKNIETLLQKDKGERLSRQNDLDNRLTLLEHNIEQAVSDLEEAIGKTSEDVLENRLFSERAPVLRKLRAFRVLIALRHNGEVRTTGVKLACANPVAWCNVSSSPLGVKVVDQNYFDDVMEEINRGMLNGHMA